MTKKIDTVAIVRCALMTAVVAVCTMLGFNVGTGFVNFGDTMIYITAYLLGPIPAMVAGGIGSLIADSIVYPLTMWFTLFIKGIEGLLAGIMFKYVAGRKPYRTPVRITLGVVSMLVGGAFMILGYFGTQALFWGDESTGKLAAAIAQVPWDCLQTGVSVVLASIFIYVIRIEKAVKLTPATVSMFEEDSKEIPAESDNAEIIDAEVIEDKETEKQNDNK
ncbi:MAG: ECF transporter S component [Christensenellales bacterium]